MEQYEEPQELRKQNVSSTLSMFPPNSNSAHPSSSSAMTHPTPGTSYPQFYPPNPPPGYSYPETHAAFAGEQSHHLQPGYVYPGPPVLSYQQQQQQQGQVVVVNSQPMGVAPVFVVGSSPVSMVGAIVLSCFVFWCCGWLFGGIAFILAMVGQSSAAAGDTRGAIQLRNASYGLSIAGIVIAVIIIGVVAGVVGSAYRAAASRTCYNSYYGYYNC